MKKNFFWMLMPLLAFVSCNNELEDSLNANQNQGTAGIEYPSYFSVMKVPKKGVTTRAGIPDPGTDVAKWDDFATIRIYFMNGTPTLINKVKSVANTYTELTNLTFKYVNNPAVSDVRIMFSNHNTDNNLAFNWSYLGKQCLQVSTSEPTMNLAIADINNIVEANDVNFRASILREFGHMLGMIYEYQRSTTNPAERVVLNYDNIYEDLGFYTGEEEWFNEYDKNLNDKFELTHLIDTDTASRAFDENSIMLPYMPAGWIKTTGIGANKTTTEVFEKVKEKRILDLSDNDKAYIAAVYPKPEVIYERGKEGNVEISFEGNDVYLGYGDPFVAGWDYRTNTDARRHINNYPTIQIGEYEWTTVNTRLKYRGLSSRPVQFDNTMVNFLVGDAFGNDGSTVEKFERIFGNWASELASKPYHYLIPYKDGSAVFDRNDNEFSEDDVEFELPDVTAIQQLFGQMPHETGNVYTDFRNFTFGLPDNVISNDPQLASVLAQRMPFLNEHNKNISGLSLVPLGSMHPHSEGELGNRYQTRPGLWENNAFMTTGTGVKLKMKVYNGAIQRNFNFHESAEEGREIILNQYLFHYGSVRYCRALTDEELGYKLYVDESSNIVVRFGLDELPDGNEYRELSRGVERGVALSNLYIDEDNGIYYFTKSWSQIQQIAATINAYVRVHY